MVFFESILRVLHASAALVAGLVLLMMINKIPPLVPLPENNSLFLWIGWTAFVMQLVLTPFALRHYKRLKEQNSVMRFPYAILAYGSLVASIFFLCAVGLLVWTFYGIKP